VATEAEAAEQEDAAAEAYELTEEQIGPGTGIVINEPNDEPRKFYIDGGEVEVIGHWCTTWTPTARSCRW
jgi:type I restriction enzyme R subunit